MRLKALVPISTACLFGCGSSGSPSAPQDVAGSSSITAGGGSTSVSAAAGDGHGGSNGRGQSGQGGGGGLGSKAPRPDVVAPTPIVGSCTDLPAAGLWERVSPTGVPIRPPDFNPGVTGV